MIIELYEAPASEAPNSPISNTTGELPDQEPTLDPANLLGSFDNREDAVAFIRQQATERSQTMGDIHSGSFDAYTHVEWLTVELTSGDQSTQTKHYYLVTDEGY